MLFMDSDEREQGRLPVYRNSSSQEILLLIDQLVQVVVDVHTRAALGVRQGVSGVFWRRHEVASVRPSNQNAAAFVKPDRLSGRDGM